jgi:hypothetical protein
LILLLSVRPLDAQAEEEAESLSVESFSDVILLDEAIRSGLIAFEGEPVEPERPAATAFAAALRSAVGMEVGVGFDLRFGLAATYDCGPGAPRETRTIDPSVRPWGLDGGGSEDFDLFGLRYWEGRRTAGCWPSGFAAELFGVNKIALNNWARTGCFEPPLPRAGEATSEEQYDLAVTAGGRRHPLYQKCWWELEAGGHRDRPVIVSGGNWGFYRGVAATNKVCATGLHSWPSIWGWPQFLRVDELPADRPWCGSAPPPEPVPAPVPVPVPPPPVPTTPLCPPDRLERCQGLKSPFGQATCSGCPCPAETPPRLVNGEAKAWHCTPVAPAPEPPPVPVDPPPCPPSGFEVGCSMLGGELDLCRALARSVGACDPECDSQCYIPGVPSTGGLEVVQVPGGGR